MNARVVVFGVVVGALIAITVGGAVGAVAHSRAKERLARFDAQSGSMRRWQRLLIASQATAAVVILTLAFALGQHLIELQAQRSGIDETALSARLILPPAHSAPERARVFTRELLRRIRAIPDIERAGLINLLPLSGWTGSHTFTTAHLNAAAEAIPASELRMVDADYFATLRIPLLEGRFFHEGDHEGTSPVVIVNQAFARQHLDGSPVGQRIGLGSVNAEVVGVVADVKTFGIEQEPRPEMFRPFWQAPVPILGIVVQARSAADVAGALRQALAEIDSTVPLTHAMTFEQLARESIRLRRAGTILMLFATAASIVLVGCGLHGLLANFVALRRRELAVRIAVGAGRRRLIGAVTRDSCSVVVAGAALGVAFALAGLPLIDRIGLDSVPIRLHHGVVAVFVVVVVSLLAAWSPARQALRTDAAYVLRN